jgi:hypothetical protein
LIVPTLVDAGLISVALRGRGIFVEGAIPVPATLEARRPHKLAKLRVSLISKGKYWRAFEDIPDDELPPFALKYVINENEEMIHKRKVKLYVRRGNAFRLAEDEELISDEPFYRRRLQGGFERTGTFVPQ